MDDKIQLADEPNPGGSHELNIIRQWEEYLNENSSDKEWLITIRHGERLDLIDKQWFERWPTVKAMSDGERKKAGLDYFPHHFPRRQNFKDFTKDVPLTTRGEEKARNLGRDMKQRGIIIKAVYSSPAFRCIQTAKCLCEGLDYKGKVNIENGLIEMLTMKSFLLGCQQHYMPVMKREELEQEGINIDANYVPLISAVEDIAINETIDEYGYRLLDVYRHCKTDAHIRVASKEKGAILLVGHWSTVGGVTWKMRYSNKITKIRFLMEHLKFNFLHHEMCCINQNERILWEADDVFTDWPGKKSQYKQCDSLVFQQNNQTGRITWPAKRIMEVLTSVSKNVSKL